MTYVFARIIDIILLVSIIYGIQKFTGKGMKFNIEDSGNLIFISTLSICAYVAGYCQRNLEIKS